MKPSDAEEVREMYEATADSYAKMMDSEIDLPVYADVLGRLSERIASIPGAVIDTSCGSGHMLAMYRERYDRHHPLLGIDSSPRMVGIAGKRLASRADVVVGDMRDLAAVQDGAAAAVVSFFAVHHLEPAEVCTAFREWYRVLSPGGQLLVAAWEGTGAIDYGGASDIVALRYRSDEIVSWARAAGFTVTRCVVEPVEEMPMDAIYLEADRG
jgi:ubiquinone/menaquinone biosynthesis C-methylase UbiE